MVDPNIFISCTKFKGGRDLYIEVPTYVSKCLTEFSHLRHVFTANGYPDRLLRNMLPGRPTTMNTRSRTAMEGHAPKLLLLPYIAGVTEKIDCVCRPLSDLWLQGQDGRSFSESEAAHPQTRQEGSRLRYTLWKVQSCVHRRNTKDSEEATHRTQSGSEEV